MRWFIVVLACVVIVAGALILVALESFSLHPKGYVTYDRAVALLCSGEVKSVFQNHHREVSLDLKNGTRLNTVEPRIDIVFDDCNMCPVCRGTQFATE